MELFENVVATFDPKRTDDLVEGAAELIGREFTWEAAFIIEDGYDYAGQWAMAPVDVRTPFAWVPFCDLNVKENYE